MIMLTGKSYTQRPRLKIHLSESGKLQQRLSGVWEPNIKTKSLFEVKVV